MMIFASVFEKPMPHNRLQDIAPVILAGGEGRRLRPLSTPRKPKPFLRFFSRHSLLQKTLDRCRSIGLQAPSIVCNAAHRSLVLADIQKCDNGVHNIFLEPSGRGTAPAIAVAAHYFSKDNPLLLVMPSDHGIDQPELLARAVEIGMKSARQGKLVMFGIKPNRPETGFGYIRSGTQHDENIYDVAAFIEKPDRATAQNLLRDQNCFWNSGLFLFSAHSYLTQLQELAPDIHDYCLQAVNRASRMRESIILDEQAFQACPSASIDRAIMEKAESLVVVPVDMAWRDLGTWRSLLRNIFIK